METKTIRFLADKGFAKAGSVGAYPTTEADRLIAEGMAEQVAPATEARGAPEDHQTGRRGRRFQQPGDDE